MVSALRWIDLDVGQLEQPNPPVAYPCALVDISIRNAEDVSSKIQDVDYRIGVRIAFNFVGETSGAAPEAVRINSTEYFNVRNDVYKVLQGLSTPSFDALTHKSSSAEKRSDGLKVINVEFITTGRDVSAADEAVTGWG